MPMRRSFAVAACIPLAVMGEDLGSLLRTGHGHGDHAPRQLYGGEQMERTFTMYVDLPVGEAQLTAQGWHKHNSQCDPNLGFVWTEDADGPTKSQPLKLYTTAGGQPAGVGTVILGWGQDPLPQAQKQWENTEPLVQFKGDSKHVANHAHVDVAFRSGAIVCSGEQSAGNVGDTLIVNPGGTSSKTLPLTDSAAQAEGWMRGSCFDGMGFHWFLDTNIGSNKLSWKAENLFPVVTMFHEGQINAIFFASTIDQVSIPIFQSNEWEPKSLSNSEICNNICDKDCTFSGLTSAGPWSTQHIYFNDHSTVTCAENLKCGLTWPIRGNCCEANYDVLV